MQVENKRRLDRGVLLALLGILLATLLTAAFHFVDNHRRYWAAAPMLGVLGIVTAFCGGFLVGNSIGAINARRARMIFLVGIFAGVVVMITN